MPKVSRYLDSVYSEKPRKYERQATDALRKGLHRIKTQAWTPLQCFGQRIHGLDANVQRMGRGLRMTGFTQLAMIPIYCTQAPTILLRTLITQLFPPESSTLDPAGLDIVFSTLLYAPRVHVPADKPFNFQYYSQ